MKRPPKKNSIEQLNKMVVLADEIAENADLNGLNGIKELTEQYLARGAEPERIQLSRLYYSGAIPLTGKDGVRRRLGIIDLGYFGRAYLPHYFSRPSPAFHAELDNTWKQFVWKTDVLTVGHIKRLPMVQGRKSATAAPRGHAKSTNLTFKDDLHAIVYEYKHFIMILSDVADQAIGFLEAIKEELETNEAIREDFGDLTGRVWRDNVIITKTNIKVIAKGAGQKVRGLKHKQWRPDLIVLDDIENDELVRTVEQRKKLENWFYKAVSKCGDSYTDIVYIGTLLHYDSLLAKVLKNPAYQSKKYKAVLSFSKEDKLWAQWADIYNDLGNDARAEDARAFFDGHKKEMLEGTQVLWEEKLSYYDLMEMRLTEGEAAFNSEEQNEPINPDDCLFNEEWFEYFDESQYDFADKLYKFYGFVDPSMGKSKKSDYSAIITIAHDTVDGWMYVLDADVERRHPDKIIDDVLYKATLIKMMYGKRYEIFGAETNQFQAFFKDQLAKESAKSGVYLPLQGINQNSDKTMRIQTLQPYVKNKYLRFKRNQKLLLEQLKYFPMADHDDAPDALEGCVSLIISKKKRRIIGIRGLGI